MGYTALPTNWVDNTLQSVNATYLNNLDTQVNAVITSLKLSSGGVQTAEVATSETTTSTSYADLATTTDDVTVTIGQGGVALVILSALTVSSVANALCTMSFAYTGANSFTPSDDSWSCGVRSPSATLNNPINGFFVVTGLSTGSTVFKAKYRTSTGTATYLYRRISVIALP